MGVHFKSQTFTASVSLPKKLTDTGYYLIADVNPQNTIQETGKGNNLAVYNTASSPTTLSARSTIATATAARQGVNTTLRKTVFWNNATTGENVLWYTDDPTWLKGNTTDQTQGVYATLPSQTPNSNWKFQTTLDLDGDQQSDILWRNAQTGALQA